MTQFKMMAIVCLALLASLAMPVQADDSPSMLLGYCGETPYTGFTLGARDENIVAVQFDEEFVERFDGCEVTAVRTCISGIVGNTIGVWLTDELPAKIPNQSDPNDIRTLDYYKAAAKNYKDFAYHFPYEAWIDPTTVQPWEWVEASFDEGYVIQKGKPFYAGFRSFAPPGAVQSSVIAAENGGTDVHSWVYFPGSDDPWCPLSQTSMASYGVNLMIQVRVAGESLPKNNIAMSAINGSEFVQKGEPQTLECVMQNLGVNTITSFDVTYSLDGVPQGTKTLRATGLEYRQYAGFRLEGITFDTTGEHTVSVTISRPNGEADTDESDNYMERTFTVYNSEDVVARNVLIETFTGITCGNCPAAHEREAEAFADRDVIMVAHHAGFYDDLLTTDADKSYTWFFNQGGSTFAPAIMMDRTNVNSFYATDYPGPVFYPGDPSEMRMVYETLEKVPATVSVSLSANYDPSTRQLTVNASGDVISTPGGKDHRINVWLVESGIKTKQSQSGSSLGRDYIHDHVFRKNLSGTWGDAISLAGKSYEKSYTCTLDAAWVPENMEVVAFLANIDADDATNCRVLNANKIPLTSAEGIRGVIGNQATTISVENYGIDGRRQSETGKGLTITRTIQADGSTTSSKVLR